MVMIIDEDELVEGADLVEVATESDDAVKIANIKRYMLLGKKKINFITFFQTFFSNFFKVFKSET